MDSNCDSIGKKPCDDEQFCHVTKNLSEPMPQQAVLWIDFQIFLFFWAKKLTNLKVTNIVEVILVFYKSALKNITANYSKWEMAWRPSDPYYCPREAFVFASAISVLTSNVIRDQSFTSLMADLRQDINIVSSFSRCHKLTFP